MSGLQLKVGKRYRRRDGEVVEIVLRLHANRLRCQYGRQYLDNGNRFYDGSESPHDLIEEVPDEPSDCIKTPQPGEWWLDEDGDLGYVHGLTDNARLVFKFRSDSKTYACNCSPDNLVRHLPDCTGWDYKVPDEEPERKMKNVTMHKWVYKFEGRWSISTWREVPPAFADQSNVIDTKEVEVPCD